MTALFGLSLTVLFNAIAMVESDRGATSDNVYQIRNIYIDDLNRIYTYRFKYSDKYDKRKSEQMMFDYWRYYGYRYTRLTGRPVTYEVLARIHNGGPDGWRKKSTEGYWRRVERHLNYNNDCGIIYHRKENYAR